MDVVELGGIAKRYEVKSWPAVIAVKGNRYSKAFVGDQSQAAVHSDVEDALSALETGS